MANATTWADLVRSNDDESINVIRYLDDACIFFVTGWCPNIKFVLRVCACCVRVQ